MAESQLQFLLQSVVKKFYMRLRWRSRARECRGDTIKIQGGGKRPSNC